MRWSQAIPHNPDLALMSPYDTTLATIRTLAEHDAIRPRLVDQELARAVSRPPPINGDSFGALEAVGRGATSNETKLKGWAAADRVVIGYDAADASWRLLTVVSTGTERPDVAARSANESLMRSGFEHTIHGANVPKGENRFRAWAVDEAAQRVWPLAGSVRDAPERP